MEKLLVSAVCLLTGLVAIALAHRPARALAPVLNVARHDAALWMLF
ncbi:MAG TPA: hypothetical protein VF007_10815 [Stellaceae bacterium]|jgi:hypothetical protein